MKVNAKKVLSLNNISKSYQNNLVINNFSIDFNYGNSVGMIGKNGSGKSTILKISCGLLKPDSGNVLLMGKSFDSTEDGLLIKSRMGVVLHEEMLYPQLTVFENLNFYSKILGIKNVNTKIEELSTLLKLSDYLKISVSKLSNGNKKRVSFAKSLLNDPDILFADEPESNLDDKGKEIVLQFAETFARFEIRSKDQIMFRYFKGQGLDRTHKRCTGSFELSSYQVGGQE